jgi:hypothetical protein
VIRVAWLLVAACAADDGGPRLESAMPAAAGHDATVTLTGTRLCIPTATTDLCSPLTVALGLDLPMVDAPVIAVSASSAMFTVPQAAPVGATEIIVTADGRSSNALAFEVTP